MRPAPSPTAAAAAAVATTTATTASEMGKWNSPIPYLFAGLGMMLILIAVALTILACSFKKSNSDEKPARPPVPVMQPEMEPKIVVIMAGDENPKYLAKPVKVTNAPLL